MMLKVQNLDVYYGENRALSGVNLEVGKGEIVTVLGRNGAGKSTILRTIIGLVKPRGGSITLNGVDITGLVPEKIATRGVAYVPDNKRLFPQLTVLENMRVSALGAHVQLESALKDGVLEYFPALKLFLGRKAGTLSGGEQQMLTIARALLRKSALVLMDEPSQGLAPSVIDGLKRAVLDSKKEFGISFLIVEQEIKFATEVAERIYGILNGSVVYEGTAKHFLNTEAYRQFLVIV